MSMAGAVAIAIGFIVPTVSAAPASAGATSSTSSTTAPSGPNCAAAVGGTVLSRSGWEASTNAPSSGADVAANALDGNLATRFSTDEDQAAGIYIEVDMGQAQTFDELEMAVPGSPTDYARAYAVEVSANATSWATIAACTGSGTLEIISFPAQAARYLRVVLTTGAADWWSVDELNLYAGPPPATSTTSTSTTTTTRPTTTTTTRPTTTTTAPVNYDCAAPADGALLNRSGWGASSNAPSSSADSPGNALDGNLGTRFSTDRDQADGYYFEVDLRQAQAFDQLEMYVPGSPNDYARAYLVQVSDNSSSWYTVAACTGTSSTEIVRFPTQTARFVRVELTGATGWYWSIDEFYLYSAGCAAAVRGYPLDRSGWGASSNAPSSSADSPGNALDGNLGTRFSTDRDQADGYYFEVDLRQAQAFDELEMYVPGSPNDYARAYLVQVSDNSSSWYTVAACTGTGPEEVDSFPAQTARYVRVVLTAGADNWWSIDELNLYSSAPTATATTTSLWSSANPVTEGGPLTWTARVAPVPPGGTVSFLADGSPVAGCSSLPVSTSSGEATCSATYYSAQVIGVRAYYSGEGQFQPAASAPYTQVVSPPAAGYWLATRSGAVYGVGAAPSLGGVSTSRTSGRVVGMAATPTARGYWVVTANGTVANFGDARFFGDLPDLGRKVRDVVAIAPTPDGGGYYLLGSDGGFFAFGDARYRGSLPAVHVHVRNIVGMVVAPNGAGYLMTGADGSVYAFGQSRYYGSLPALRKHVHDVRAILVSAMGRGYVLVGSDGGAFVFGTGVAFHGSLPGERVRVADIVGIALTADGGGYYMAGSDGRVYSFGDAPVWAEPAGLGGQLPVAAIAGT
jgi:hypothetical protein